MPTADISERTAERHLSPGRDALLRGREPIERGKAAAAGSARERDYLAALGKFFGDFETVDHTDRVLAYEQAMEALHARYPHDGEAAVFHGLALLGSAASMPPDKTYARQKKAGEILQPIFRAQPEHPGVAHYIIHAYDYPALAAGALDAARRYARIASDSPHALHMPSHIFTRLGLWDESIASNRKVVAAARRHGIPGEALHGSDYLVFAHLQRGEGEQARRVIDEAPQLAEVPRDATIYSAGLYATATRPARHAVERRAWAEAAALPDPAGFPGGRYAWAEASTYFARALGAARTGDTSLARREIGALRTAHRTLVEHREDYWAGQVEVQRRGAEAWLVFADGRRDEALILMQSAVDLEERADKHPVTPGQIVPARDLLAQMLLARDESAGACARRVHDGAGSGAEPIRRALRSGAGRRAVGSNDASARCTKSCCVWRRTATDVKSSMHATCSSVANLHLGPPNTLRRGSAGRPGAGCDLIDSCRTSETSPDFRCTCTDDYGSVSQGRTSMKRASVAVGSLSAVLLGAIVMAQAPSNEIDAHVVAARSAAGLEFRNTFLNLCMPGQGARRGAASGPAAAGRGAAGQAAAGRGGAGMGQTPDRANWYAPPFKVFDNLFWLGTRQHSSWALQTSGGIIVIDTNFAWATRPEIIEGLTKLGLNPADIKYVIISHAHGDHDQGAAELQERYGAKVVMGTADWEATLKRPATAAGGVPTKDIAVGPEGYKLTLGDTTIDIVATPGHSPGTLSYVFPVKDQGQTVTIAYSGGTLTGSFGTDGQRWDEYIASQQRIAKAAADAGASVILSNHSEYDGAYTKARLIAAPRQVGENHPFIVGTDAVQRYFTVMSECATASKLRLGAK